MGTSRRTTPSVWAGTDVGFAVIRILQCGNPAPLSSLSAAHEDAGCIESAFGGDWDRQREPLACFI